MKKSQEVRRKEVENMLQKQKIRSVEQIEAYKLSVCHPDSAGIDLGSAENYVALNPAIAAEMNLPIVRKFSTTTTGHEECRDFLLQCGVKDVCMESTGIYWINLHYILTEAGIHVCLVNPKMFRMVPGRKTDILDCQWLQTLHMYGLCRGSFIQEGKLRMLRTYIRERENCIQDRSRYCQRMQKALVQMNIMLVNVVSDITGKTGMDIIRAIIGGIRDPKTLAMLRNGRCKRSQEEIEESLNGIYKEDQMFLLKQNYAKFTFINQQIAELDQQIGRLLASFPSSDRNQVEKLGAPVNTTSPFDEGHGEKTNQDNGKEKERTEKKKLKKRSKNDIMAGIDLEQRLLEILGVDLTTITGLAPNSILQIISEVGTDMSLFPSEKHFVSYLGFAPRNKITGGRLISSKTDRKKSHAAQAFKKVIPSISRNKSALAGFYHRIAARKNAGEAIVATARKLAVIFYNTLKFGKEFVERGQDEYKKMLEEREKAKLAKLAKKYHMELAPAI